MGSCALFGDSAGVPQLLAAVTDIACIVGASIRPQYNDLLRQIATDHDVPFLIQPKRNSAEFVDFVQQVQETSPEWILCNSYSMLLPTDLLHLAPSGAANIHGSLLPRNRGNNPTQWAIIKGETETGVTLHLMDHTLDTGAVLAQRSVPIELEDTWVTVNENLAEATRQLIAESVPQMLRKELVPLPQDSSLASSNPRLNKDSPRIEESMTDIEVYNLIRAQVVPLNGAYIETANGRVHFPNFVPLENIPQIREIAGIFSNTI
jgi:methionyl-tRNA formyltransferase